MYQLMKKFALGMVLMICSLDVLADCNASDLAGNWKIFYRDNGFPTSVLAPEETLAIKLDDSSGNFSVHMTDPDWWGVNGNWETECVDGQPILLGAIQQRRGRTTLVIEISRVTIAEDLLPLPDGELPERQINIRFPQPVAAMKQLSHLAEMAEQGKLSSHPGHAHGWD